VLGTVGCDVLEEACLTVRDIDALLADGVIG